MDWPVHLNTAGAGRMSALTVAAMTRQLSIELRLGSYEAEAAGQLAADVRHGLARLLHGRPEQVALFDSATRAYQAALDALDGVAPLAPGARIWTTPYEYAGHLLALQRLARRHSLRLQVMGLRPDGDLCLDWLEQHAGPDLALVSLVHVPSYCGTVLPVAEICRRLQRLAPQALRAVDACQSVGQLPVDMRGWGTDLITGAGRKFLRGPRGTGFALLAERWLQRLGDHPLDLHAARVVDLHQAQRTDRSSARQLEAGELSQVSLAGLHQAVLEAQANDMGPRDTLYAGLSAWLASRPEIQLVAPGAQQAGILCLRHHRWTAAALVDALQARGLNTWRAQAAHTPLLPAPHGGQDGLRLSLHSPNSADDVTRLQDALQALAECR